MRASYSREAHSRVFGAASTRRLSKRDLRELVRLTGALQVTSAPAFERFGVVVHLPANHPQDEQRRPPGEQAEPGGAASAQHVDGAPQGPGRTARQQRRYGRGQQAAQRRKEAKKSTPLEKNSGCTQEVAAAEQAAGAYAAAIQSSFDATSASAADDSHARRASRQTRRVREHSHVSSTASALRLRLAIGGQ